jgi:acetyl-CoA synthetase
MAPNQSDIENLLHESRSFPPTEAFAAQAVAKKELYDQASKDRLGFWADKARELHWHKPFTKTLDFTNPPFAKWFEDGELNVCYNALDRHVLAGKGDKVALYFEGESGDSLEITYSQLLTEVKKAANAFTSLGVSKGDRVAIYMPLVPEAVVAMLATVRLGAIHSVIFGGFSAESLRSRINDAEAKLVVTADGGNRKGKVLPLKPAVDEAIADGACQSVEHVLVLKRCGNEVAWNSKIDLWWEDVVGGASDQHEAQGFESENPLFILYTSGTTGKPKGILHTSGGYLTQATFTHKALFDVHPETDIYWCTADVGWITGHSYVVYGPLTNGVSQVIYEGTPDTPDWGRWWQIIEKYKVSIFYTAPTAIRTFMKHGREIPDKYDLSSLRVLGSVGEPINPDDWMWYREAIGRNNCPIVDTWWHT